MNRLNLKGFALSVIACTLVAVIMSFPTYLATLMENLPALLTLLALLGAILVFYIHRQVGNIGYGMLILKLTLLTISYILLATAVLKLSDFNFRSGNYRAFLAVTALYSIGMLFLFKSPYLKIYANIVLIGSIILMVLTKHNYLNFGNYCPPILLSIFVILSLSASGIRYYTFLIALVIVLMVINSVFILIGTFDIYFIKSTPYLLINYLPLLAFIPFIVKNRHSLLPKHVRMLIIGSIPSITLLTLLPISVVSGIVIIAIAFYLQSRTIHTLGVVLFIGSLYFYYYNLNTTLSMKGLILIGSGLLILIAQWIVVRFVPTNINAQEENNHAH